MKRTRGRRQEEMRTNKNSITIRKKKKADAYE